MNPEELISAWEDAYREYGEDADEDLRGTSRAVAKAWCALAESVDLPWWLYAAVRSAAEAFEVQGEPGSVGVTAMLVRRGGVRFGGKTCDDGDDLDLEDDQGMAGAESGGRSCSCSPAESLPVGATFGMRWPRGDDDLVNAAHGA